MTINQALHHILSEYGRATLQDHKRVEALLRDLCPEENQRRDVNLAVVALKEGIPRELIAMSAPVEIVVGRLVKRLDDQHYYPEHVAKLSIETWANALNISLPKSAHTQASAIAQTLVEIPRSTIKPTPPVAVVSTKPKTVKPNINDQHIQKLQIIGGDRNKLAISTHNIKTLINVVISLYDHKKNNHTQLIDNKIRKTCSSLLELVTSGILNNDFSSDEYRILSAKTKCFSIYSNQVNRPLAKIIF